MKMVKSLLLGAAAGLVALTGAQAADLPVKAKPVQYVKICSLYGAGFYYIPGTDTCLKIGGFVRNESGYGAGGSFATYLNGGNALFDRTTDMWMSRTRTALSLDVRKQTEYGTLRSYFHGGFQWSTADGSSSNSGALYFLRGFIQIAGFTTGKTASFYDFFSHATYSYQTQFLAGESAGSGINVFAYTAQFGNGLSATASLEDSSYRRSPVVDLGAGTLPAFNANIASDSIGSKAPDVVANLRIDQAWGSAQVQGAGHIVGGRSYGASTVTHPDDKWGTAFGAGASFNLPMIGKGDTVAVAANWCNGAARYCTNPSTANGTGLIFGVRNGGTVAMGEVQDAAFGAAGTSLELSRAWSISGGFQHFWTPQWKTGVYAQYLDYKQNSGQWDTLVCTARGFTAGCGDFKGYQIGSRTQWSPVSDLDVGIDVMYTKAQTAYAGGVVAVGPNGGTATLHSIGDVGIWSGFFRVQRNFYP